MRTVWDDAEEGNVYAVLESFGEVKMKKKSDGNTYLGLEIRYLDGFAVDADGDGGYSVSVTHGSATLVLYDNSYGKTSVALKGEAGSLYVGDIDGRIVGLKYREDDELSIDGIFDGGTDDAFEREGRLVIRVKCNSERCI